jgi:hypothetical protein
MPNYYLERCLAVLLAAVCQGGCADQGESNRISFETHSFGAFTAHHYRYVPSTKPDQVVISQEVPRPDPENPHQKYGVAIYSMSAKLEKSWIASDVFYSHGRLNLEFWNGDYGLVVGMLDRVKKARAFQHFDPQTGQLAELGSFSFAEGRNIIAAIPGPDNGILLLTDDPGESAEEVHFFDGQAIHPVTLPQRAISLGWGFMEQGLMLVVVDGDGKCWLYRSESADFAISTEMDWIGPALVQRRLVDSRASGRNFVFCNEVVGFEQDGKFEFRSKDGFRRSVHLFDAVRFKNGIRRPAAAVKRIRANPLELRAEGLLMRSDVASNQSKLIAVSDEKLAILDWRYQRATVVSLAPDVSQASPER